MALFYLLLCFALAAQTVQGLLIWRRGVSHARYTFRDQIKSLGAAYLSQGINVPYSNDDIMTTLVMTSALQSYYGSDPFWPTPIRHMGPERFLLPCHPVPVWPEYHDHKGLLREENGAPIRFDLKAGRMPAAVDMVDGQAVPHVQHYAVVSSLVYPGLPKTNTFEKEDPMMPIFWDMAPQSMMSHCWYYVLTVYGNALLTIDERKILDQMVNTVAKTPAMMSTQFQGTYSGIIEKMWASAIGLSPVHTIYDQSHRHPVPKGSILFMWARSLLDQGFDPRMPGFESQYLPQKVAIVVDAYYCNMEENWERDHILCTIALYGLRPQSRQAPLTSAVRYTKVKASDLDLGLFTYTTTSKDMTHRLDDLWGHLRRFKESQAALICPVPSPAFYLTPNHSQTNLANAHGVDNARKRKYDGSTFEDASSNKRTP